MALRLRGQSDVPAKARRVQIAERIGERRIFVVHPPSTCLWHGFDVPLLRLARAKRTLA